MRKMFFASLCFASTCLSASAEENFDFSLLNGDFHTDEVFVARLIENVEFFTSENGFYPKFVEIAAHIPVFIFVQTSDACGQAQLHEALRQAFMYGGDDREALFVYLLDDDSVSEDEARLAGVLRKVRGEAKGLHRVYDQDSVPIAFNVVDETSRWEWGFLDYTDSTYSEETSYSEWSKQRRSIYASAFKRYGWSINLSVLEGVGKSELERLNGLFNDANQACVDDFRERLHQLISGNNEMIEKNRDRINQIDRDRGLLENYLNKID